MTEYTFNPIEEAESFYRYYIASYTTAIPKEAFGSLVQMFHNAYSVGYEDAYGEVEDELEEVVEGLRNRQSIQRIAGTTEV